MRQRILLITLVSIAAVGYTSTKWKVDRVTKRRTESVDIRHLPSPRIARIISFGYRPSLADLYWIEALNYFGGQLLDRKRPDFKYLKSYTKLIPALDPAFALFYEWGATSFIYNTLPISRTSIVNSMNQVNLGIKNLDKIHRYAPNLILKGAFNYAIEAHEYALSVPYFELAANIFPEKRDMFIVGAAFASHGSKPEVAIELQKRFFGQIAFEAPSKDQIVYAMRILATSPTLRSADFLRSLRVNMERDDDMRKIVEQRMANNPIFEKAVFANESLVSDPRIDNLLNINYERNWLSADMHVLFSL